MMEISDRLVKISHGLEKKVNPDAPGGKSCKELRLGCFKGAEEAKSVSKNLMLNQETDAGGRGRESFNKAVAAFNKSPSRKNAKVVHEMVVKGVGLGGYHRSDSKRASNLLRNNGYSKIADYTDPKGAPKRLEKSAVALIKSGLRVVVNKAKVAVFAGLYKQCSTVMKLQVAKTGSLEEAPFVISPEVLKAADEPIAVVNQMWKNEAVSGEADESLEGAPVSDEKVKKGERKLRFASEAEIVVTSCDAEPEKVGEAKRYKTPTNVEDNPDHNTRDKGGNKIAVHKRPLGQSSVKRTLAKEGVSTTGYVKARSFEELANKKAPVTLENTSLAFERGIEEALGSGSINSQHASMSGSALASLILKGDKFKSQLEFKAALIRSMSDQKVEMDVEMFRLLGGEADYGDRMPTDFSNARTERGRVKAAIQDDSLADDAKISITLGDTLESLKEKLGNAINSIFEDPQFQERFEKLTGIPVESKK